jgi:hypothetical protein
MVSNKLSFLEKQLLRHYNNDAERKKEIERREKEKAEQAKIGMPNVMVSLSEISSFYV